MRNPDNQPVKKGEWVDFDITSGVDELKENEAPEVLNKDKMDKILYRQ